MVQHLLKGNILHFKESIKGMNLKTSKILLSDQENLVNALSACDGQPNFKLGSHQFPSPVKERDKSSKKNTQPNKNQHLVWPQKRKSLSSARPLAPQDTAGLREIIFSSFLGFFPSRKQDLSQSSAQPQPEPSLQAEQEQGLGWTDRGMGQHLLGLSALPQSFWVGGWLWDAFLWSLELLWLWVLG